MGKVVDFKFTKEFSRYKVGDEVEMDVATACTLRDVRKVGNILSAPRIRNNRFAALFNPDVNKRSDKVEPAVKKRATKAKPKTDK